MYSIEQYLKYQNELHSNMTIISNQYEWDESGNAVGIKDPIIHSLNKDETSIRKYQVFDAVKDRKNVILLGDKVGDTRMIEGFDYDTLLRVCFLRDKNQEHIDECKQHFDVLILDD